MIRIYSSKNLFFSTVRLQEALQSNNNKKNCRTHHTHPKKFLLNKIIQ